MESTPSNRDQTSLIGRSKGGEYYGLSGVLRVYHRQMECIDLGVVIGHHGGFVGSLKDVRLYVR